MASVRLKKKCGKPEKNKNKTTKIWTKNNGKKRYNMKTRQFNKMYKRKRKKFLTFTLPVKLKY